MIFQVAEEVSSMLQDEHAHRDLNPVYDSFLYCGCVLTLVGHSNPSYAKIATINAMEQTPVVYIARERKYLVWKIR